MTTAEIAFLGSSISLHLPNRRNRSATSPLVMKVLPPSIRIWSPSGVRRVRMPVASEPASGSVMQRQPRPPSAILGSRRRFCSSLPKSIKGFIEWKLVDQTLPVAAQALASSRAQAR